MTSSQAVCFQHRLPRPKSADTPLGGCGLSHRLFNPATPEAALTGERDPWKLAKLRDRRIKATEEEIARSLEGNWREDMLFELRQAVDAYDFIQKQIAACDQRLKTLLEALPARPVAEREAEAGAAEADRRSKQRRTRQKNTPGFDLKEELRRICGVDLTRIDGIDVMTTQTFVAEVGTDMSRWPTEDHFASWLTLTPNRDISGGKVVRQEPRKSKSRVAAALRTAACTLLRSESYLGAKYRALRARLGAPKAIKAMARHLACLMYRMLRYGQAYVDQGTQQFEQKRAQRELLSLQRKAAALGYQLVQPASV